LIATTAEDNRNVAIAVIAQTFGVRRVIARVRDPRAAHSFERLRVETVCPTTLEARLILDHIERVLRSDRARDARVSRGQESRGVMRSLQIVVAGCGRLGSHLASSLSQQGHGVTAIDANAAALEALRTGSFNGRPVGGDATEPSVLRQAGIEEADLVVVAIRADAISLMVAMMAETLFGVKEVVARVSEQERERMYRDLGLAAVCPTVVGGEAILSLMERDPAPSKAEGGA
jgi:trk system potassium uptake protein TrkA